MTGTEFAAFDIDDCRDPATGEIYPWAQQLVERVNSYSEITVSCTGLRIIGLGTGQAVHRKLPVADGVTCEVYRRATRYIVMTGNQFNDAGLSNIDEVIDEVLTELDQPKKAEPRLTKKQLPQDLRLMLHAQGDSPAGYPSRSELFWAFILSALRKGIDENVIVTACLDEAYAGLSIYNHVQEDGGEAYVKRQIEKALKSLRSDDNKWVIRLTPDTLDQAWRATERALLSKRCPVYVRGGSLVQPLWRQEKVDSNRTA